MKPQPITKVGTWLLFPDGHVRRMRIREYLKWRFGKELRLSE